MSLLLTVNGYDGISFHIAVGQTLLDDIFTEQYDI